jgi:hypothetical protein
MFKLYVWEDALSAWWPGMAVAIARNLDEALNQFTEMERLDLRAITPTVVPLRARGMKPASWNVHGGD